MVCQPPKTPNFFFSTRKVHHHGWFNRVTCEVLCPCRCSKLLPRMCRRPLGPDEWDIALGGQGDMCAIYCNPAPPENIFSPQNLPKTPSWGGIWMSRVVTSAHLRCHFCLRKKSTMIWKHQLLGSEIDVVESQNSTNITCKKPTEVQTQKGEQREQKLIDTCCPLQHKATNVNSENLLLRHHVDSLANLPSGRIAHGENVGVIDWCWNWVSPKDNSSGGSCCYEVNRYH